LKVQSIRLAWVAARPEDFPRDGRPEVCFLGRSNVGKSSLLNRLLHRQDIARVSKTPGRTREIHFYMLDDRYYLVDLPGFGYAKVPEALRAQWAKLLKAYFDRHERLTLAIQLVDSRFLPTALDRQMADVLVLNRIPMLVALTKADKVSGTQIATMVERTPQVLDLPPGVPVIATSSESGVGMRELSHAVVQALTGRRDIAAAETEP
jgi:GTP-binding protein